MDKYKWDITGLKSSSNRILSGTFPGADISSDHDIVVMTLRLKLKENLQSHGTRLSSSTLKKLKYPQVADLFDATIGGKFATLVRRKHTQSHRALIDIASEVLGKARKKKKPWVTSDILDLLTKEEGASRTEENIVL